MVQDMLWIKLSTVSQTHLQRGRRNTSMGYIFHSEDPLKSSLPPVTCTLKKQLNPMPAEQKLGKWLL